MFSFRFDAGGPGSCLKRYSDPTFFKRASVASGEASIDKISKEKKGRKTKVICSKSQYYGHAFLFELNECHVYLLNIINN